jgi:hypothetical protein
MKIQHEMKHTHKTQPLSDATVMRQPPNSMTPIFYVMHSFFYFQAKKSLPYST